MHDAVQAADALSAGAGIRAPLEDTVLVHGRYHVQAHNAAGELLWAEEFDNLVTTVGKNDLLDKYLAGSAYTAQFKIGLKGTGAANAADTMASHAGWSEVGGTNAPAYTGNRQTPAFSAASAGSKTTSAGLVYTLTSGGTIAGLFMVSGGSATKDDTTGVLFSAGDFSAARTLAASDTITVNYTLNV